MGLFLAMSGVIGKTEATVEKCLAEYVTAAGGTFVQSHETDDNYRCVIKESNGNTTVFYPDHFMDWDAASAFLSQQLQAPVFSFHIHDGDLWMYVLYVNGEIADQFNPIPDYWDEHISQEDIDAMKGDAAKVASIVPGVKKQAIEKYLTRWDLEREEPIKAYPTDEFDQEDWQLVDFMHKLNLEYPFDDDGKPAGTIYRFVTKEKRTLTPQQILALPKKKPWWRFW